MQQKIPTDESKVQYYLKKLWGWEILESKSRVYQRDILYVTEEALIFFLIFPNMKTTQPNEIN